MDKLGNDELILIMIQMKEQYEKQYKIMENKYNSLNKYCVDEKNLTLINSGICDCCNTNVIYSVCDDTEFENECYFENNYEKCYGCNKTICNNCYDKEDKCICEHFDNPKPNKWWCKNCYDFNKKIKELK